MRLSLSTIIVLFVGLIILSSSLFTVYQTDKAIILRLGKLKNHVKDGNELPIVYEPGLHFKLPIIDEVKNFDTRINMLEVQSSRITTDEQKDVLVDFYVKWKIDDFNLFYLSTNGNKFKARDLLEQKIIGILKAEIGSRKIKDVVSGERAELMEAIRKDGNDKAKRDLGIEVVDVRFKRVDFPDEVVKTSVYPRMRAERQRAAAEIRSTGRSQAIVIRADADKSKRVLLANAEKDAKRIRGEGDAAALKIYANSYGKNIEFFEFFRTLEAYQNTFKNKSDVLVIKPEGDFFKYFKLSGNAK